MVFKHKPGWYGNKLSENIKVLMDGDTSRIPWIFCVFTENHEPSKMAAAKALSECLYAFAFNDIIRIDEQMRRTTSMEWFINWRNYKLKDFFTPGMSDNERRAICIFASFNPNGFIREDAIHEMKGFEGTLSYIILRQNDWVMQVRQAASAAFTYRLHRLSENEILAALPFAEKLKWSSRGSHGEYTKQFFSVLTSPEHQQDLLNGLKNTNIRTRKICIEALFSVFPPRTEYAFKHLNREPEPFLRAVIFRKLCGTGENIDLIIPMFLRDKFPTNRMLAFQYLIDADANNIYEIAEKFLLDKNASVRKAAQKFMYEQQPDYNLREFYINNLSYISAPAICGLSEKGLQSDAVQIEPYLNNTRNDVVKSAMTSLMHLDNKRYNPVITEMLNDNRPGIVKIARDLVLKSGHPDYRRIRKIFDETKHKHIKLKCIDVLFTAPKWSSIIYILEAMLDIEEHIRKKALYATTRWLFNFNRSFAVPSSTQVDRIRCLLHCLNDVLPHNIRKELLFVLPK